MRQKSLREMYEEAKKQPTPTQIFIEKVANICAVADVTVKGWVTGNTRPGKAVCRLLEREFETPWQVLFPELASESETPNNQ